MTKRVHLIGIGGQGLYYLALYLHYLGWQVSGADINKSERTEELKEEGIKVFIGHDPTNLDKDLDLVVVSPGVSEDVEEITAAKKRGFEVYPYRQALDMVFAELDKDSLTAKQEKALKSSNFAPLYFLDFNKTKLIGVTGTDGKTTTSTMIHHLLEQSGIKTGLVTTVMAKIGNQEMDTGLHVTTPSAQKLSKLLEKMLAKKPEVIVLEITSHGLAHYRVEGLELDLGVYTNITSEHLDFHQTWEKYVADKAKMMEMIKPKGKVILNADDRSFKLLKQKASQEQVKMLTYGQGKTDLSLSQLESNLDGVKAGIDFDDQKYQLSLPIQGEYNLYNAGAALLAVNNLGLDLEKIISSFKGFKLPKGRMEVIQKDPFWVVVDFAHTPNALEKALSSAKQLVDNQGKLIVVFGAAGQRDKYKRQEMGKIAGTLADVVVLVPEDPRREKTGQINDQIEVGIKNNVMVKRFNQDKVSARKKGINWAISYAKSSDVVIICGKGHEQSLAFGDREYPWDEIQVVKNILNQSS